MLLRHGNNDAPPRLNPGCDVEPPGHQGTSQHRPAELSRFCSKSGPSSTLAPHASVLDHFPYADLRPAVTSLSSSVPVTTCQTTLR